MYGALSSITRICKGYKFKEIQEPLIIVGELTEEGNALRRTGYGDGSRS